MMNWSRKTMAVGLLLLMLVAIELPTMGQSAGNRRALAEPCEEECKFFKNVDFSIGTFAGWVLKYFQGKFWEVAVKLTQWWAKLHTWVFGDHVPDEPIDGRSWRQWMAWFKYFVWNIKDGFPKDLVDRSRYLNCVRAGWHDCFGYVGRNAVLAGTWCPIVVRWECEYSFFYGRRKWVAPEPFDSIM